MKKLALFVVMIIGLVLLNGCDTGNTTEPVEMSSSLVSSSSEDVMSSGLDVTQSSSATLQSSSSLALSSSSCSNISSSSIEASSSSSFVWIDCGTLGTNEICDGRDGQKYGYVTIGTQVWMSKNMNYDVNIDWQIASRCYSSMESNCDIKGRLYNWDAAMLACPNGWHMPSHAEVSDLLNYVGGINEAVVKLKATSGWPLNKNGTDIYGFNMIPTGLYNSSYGYELGSSVAVMWTSTEFEEGYPYTLSMYGSSITFGDASSSKYLYYSLRCIQN